MYDEAAGVLSAVDYPRPTHPAWFSQYSNSFRVKAGTVVIFSTYVVSLTSKPLTNYFFIKLKKN